MLKKILFALLLLNAFILQAQNPFKDKKLIKDLMATGAIDYLTDKNKAISTYTKVLAIDSTYTQAYYMRGICWHALGQMDAALSDFDMVTHYQPDNAKAYAHKGVIYTELTNFEVALRDWNYAIIYDSNDATYYFSRGYVFLNLNNPWYAIKDFERAIKKGYKTQELFFNLALGYEEIGNYFYAMNNLQNANAMGKYDQDYYFHHGFVNMMLNELDSAVKDFKMVLAFDSNNAQVWFHLAYIALQKEDFRKTIEYSNKGISIFPSLAQAYNNRGLAYKGLKQSDSALADFTAATIIDPEFPDAYFNRYTIWDEKEQWARGLEELNSYLEFRPNNPEVLYARGRMKLYNTDEEGACTDWKLSAMYGNEQAKKAIEDICSKLGKTGQ